MDKLSYDADYPLIRCRNVNKPAALWANWRASALFRGSSTAAGFIDNIIQIIVAIITMTIMHALITLSVIMPSIDLEQLPLYAVANHRVK